MDNGIEEPTFEESIDKESEKDDKIDQLQEALSRPWTLQELPMMQQWLKANSPALDVISLLAAKGAKIYYNDPFVPRFNFNGSSYRSVKLTKQMLKKVDLAVILTDHTQYDYDMIVENARAVFDSRNATKKVRKSRKKIELL